MAVEGKKVWFDGKLHDWDMVLVHLVNQTVQYGLGLFEGLRFYLADERNDGNKKPAIFRLEDHTKRLFTACRAMMLDIPHREDEVNKAIIETVRANGYPEGYVRPFVFVGGETITRKIVGSSEDEYVVMPGEMGFKKVSRLYLHVAVWPWEAYLGNEARLCTVPDPRPPLSHIKVSGSYAMTWLAKQRSLKDGYDDALQLYGDNLVAECSAANIFMIKGNKLITPPLGAKILPGITRDTIIKLACEEYPYWHRGETLEIEERDFSIYELYTADECFVCGSAVEVTPVCEIDRRQISKGAGPISKNLQDLYRKVIKGHCRSDYMRKQRWLTYVG